MGGAVMLEKIEREIVLEHSAFQLRKCCQLKKRIFLSCGILQQFFFFQNVNISLYRYKQILKLFLEHQVILSVCPFPASAFHRFLYFAESVSLISSVFLSPWMVLGVKFILLQFEDSSLRLLFYIQDPSQFTRRSQFLFLLGLVVFFFLPGGFSSAWWFFPPSWFFSSSLVVFLLLPGGF